MPTIERIPKLNNTLAMLETDCYKQDSPAVLSWDRYHGKGMARGTIDEEGLYIPKFVVVCRQITEIGNFMKITKVKNSDSPVPVLKLHGRMAFYTGGSTRAWEPESPYTTQDWEAVDHITHKRFERHDVAARDRKDAKNLAPKLRETCPLPIDNRIAQLILLEMVP